MPITLKEALFLSGHNKAASTPALSPGKKADDFSLSVLFSKPRRKCPMESSTNQTSGIQEGLLTQQSKQHIPRTKVNLVLDLQHKVGGVSLIKIWEKTSITQLSPFSLIIFFMSPPLYYSWPSRLAQAEFRNQPASSSLATHKIGPFLHYNAGCSHKLHKLLLV